jgi:peptide/nickel transport system substrate-binding protein
MLVPPELPIKEALAPVNGRGALHPTSHLTMLRACPTMKHHTRAAPTPLAGHRPPGSQSMRSEEDPMKRRSTWQAVLAGLVAFGLVVGGLTLNAHAQKKGGVLKIGNLGEPPSLDPHWGTQTITEVLSNHIYEGLYSLDESYRPIPMLADGMPQVSPDGLTYTIKLRTGIKFHNGKEMTSDDVVASLRRWGQRAVYGKALFAQVADLKAVDKQTIEFKLKEKSAIVAISLAVPNNFGAIYPKEVAEKFPPDQRITEFIGTGPFKLAEWKPDQYIRMVRFDDYKPRSEPRSGYGGSRIAYVDELRWIPVPDAASRAAQVESGDLDFGDDLVADAYDRLKANPNVQPIIVKPYYWLVAVFNKKEGLMTNQKLRQAWQAALDIEPIMKTVAGGKPEFYRMDSSLAFQELPTWHTKIAGLPWNERNKDKARQLLKEAGYRGQPIRFMTTQEYKWMYDFALVTKQQLEDVGFVIDLQVMDWSTLGQRRVQPKEYDAFTTGIGNFFDPTHPVYLQCSWPGWTCDEEFQTLNAQLARETDPKKRYELWVQQTKLFYEKVPVARYGDLFGLRAARKHVKGFNDKVERPRFWGVWLEK